ncbi:DNA-binding protein [Paenibacillus sp. P96]|uniref:DNA-binding protein n=1 Tax=Paenibacillus zeirhizosphaerae TaxID=2987519 RepID=A0ABT9FNX3_9BACL|nr:DNA-binding protein [Paenibacillus sp. P96]MDP4096420.1 DNA-binding protein [Paenibacillus sp. P96]
MTEIDLRNYRDLDGLVKLLRMAYSLGNWREMIDIADHLYVTVLSIYNQHCFKQEGQAIWSIHTERPLVYYYGFSLLIKGIALRKLKKYAEERHCIRQYADLGWFKDLDEAGMEEVRRLNFLARANAFGLDLLEGQLKVLPDYVQFLKDNPQEIAAGLVNILEAAILHNFDLNDEINTLIENFNPDTTETDPLIFTRYTRVRYLLMIYRFRNKDYRRGLADTLHALNRYIHLNDMNGFKRCVAMFEMFRSYALPDQVKEYHSLLACIIQSELEEEGMNFDGERILASREGVV